MMNNKLKKTLFHATTSAFYAVILYTFFTHKYVILIERMITAWYLVLHIVFVFLRLLEDVVNYSKAQGWKLTGILSKVNNLMFISLIFPFALYLPSVYWILTYYNSSLIHPNFLDVSLPSWVSTLSHTAIAVVALVEMFTNKYNYKGNYLSSLAILMTFASVYVACLVGTYIQYGFWLYPLFHSFSTSSLPYVFILLAILLVGMFFVGALLSNFFYGEKKLRENLAENSSPELSETQDEKDSTVVSETLKNSYSTSKRVDDRSCEIFGSKKSEPSTTLLFHNTIDKEREKSSGRSIVETSKSLNRSSMQDASDSSMNSSDISEMGNASSKSLSSGGENSITAAYGSGGETAIDRHVKALANDISGKTSETSSHLSFSPKKSIIKTPTKYLKKSPRESLHFRLELLSKKGSSSEEPLDLKKKSNKEISESSPPRQPRQKIEIKSSDLKKNSSISSKIKTTLWKNNIKKNNRSSSVDSGETAKTENTNENSSDQIEMNLKMKKKDKLLLEKMIKLDNKAKPRKESITDSEKDRKSFKTIFLKIINKRPSKSKNNRVTQAENIALSDSSLKKSTNDCRKSGTSRSKVDVKYSSETMTTESSKTKSPTLPVKTAISSSEIKTVRSPKVPIIPKLTTSNHDTLSQRSGRLEAVTEVTFEETVNDTPVAVDNYSSPQVFVTEADVIEVYSDVKDQTCDKRTNHSLMGTKKKPLDTIDEIYVPVDRAIPSTSGIDSKALSENHRLLSSEKNLIDADSIGTKKEQKKNLKKLKVFNLDEPTSNEHEKLHSINKSRRNKSEILKPKRNENRKNKANKKESKNKIKVDKNEHLKTTKTLQRCKMKEAHKRSVKRKTDEVLVKNKKSKGILRGVKPSDLEDTQLEEKDTSYGETNTCKTTSRKKHHQLRSNERKGRSHELLPSNERRIKILTHNQFDSDSSESFHEIKPRRKKKRSKREDKLENTDKRRTARKHEPKDETNNLKKESSKKSKKKIKKAKSNPIATSNAAETKDRRRPDSDGFTRSRKNKIMERLLNFPKSTENNARLRTMKAAEDSTQEPLIEAIFSVIANENGDLEGDTEITKFLQRLRRSESSDGVKRCKFYAKLLCPPVSSSENAQEKIIKIYEHQPNTRGQSSYMEELRRVISRKPLSQCSTSLTST